MDWVTNIKATGSNLTVDLQNHMSVFDINQALIKYTFWFV